MGVSSGLEFFALFAMMNRLGLIISCVPVRARDMEVLLELVIRGFKMAVTTEELTSCDVDLYLPVRRTAASVTLAFGSTVWNEPKIY